MQLNGHIIFLFGFGTVIFAMAWIPICWLLLSIFTPQSLLTKYFKEPYFTLTETVMLKSFPGFLLRTIIFAGALLLPRLAKKRLITDIHQYMPKWYVISLKIFLIGVFITLGIIILTYLILTITPEELLK